MCTITEVSCYRSPDGSQYRLRFVANRFLRGMIRILAGDLLAIMRGEKQVRDVTDLLASDGRPRQVRLVPPNGLFLSGVRYPYFDRAAELPAIHQRGWVALAQ